MNTDITLIFLYWGYQLLIYGALGIFLRYLLGDRTKMDFPSFIRTVFLGVAGVGTILQPISIVTRINTPQHMFVLTAILCSFAYVMLNTNVFRSSRAASLLRRVNIRTIGIIASLGGLASLLTLHYATSEIVPYDTGLYHFQSIEIARQFPVVPGLGNLHDRLAYNNSWFLNIAFFSVGPLQDKPFLYQNSFVYLLLLVYILGRLIRCSSKANSPLRLLETAYFAIALWYFARYPLFISSISADTISYILAFFLASEVIFPPRISDKSRFLEMFFLAMYCVTVKSSAVFLFLLLIPEATRLLMNKTRYLVKLTFSLAAIGLWIAVPFVIRGYYLSGYPLFPIYQLDFFTPEWKLPITQVIDHMNQIKGWARHPGSGYLESLTQPAKVWIPKWWKIYGAQIPLRHLQILLFTVPLFTYQFFQLWKTFKNAFQVMVLLLLIHLIWFFSAPDPRFSYGSLISYLALMFAVALSFFYRLFNGQLLSSSRRIAYAVALLAIILPIYSSRRHVLTMFLEQTPEVPKIELIYRSNSAGMKIPSPKPPGEQCWKSDLACTPYFRRDLQYRGSTYESGFHIQKGESR